MTTAITKSEVKNSKKGFTLVELVVVIAILAILAAIAIPVVNSIINTASRNGALSNADTIELAIKECQADIAARNTEVYDGIATYVDGAGNSQTSNNAATAHDKISVAEVGGMKAINDAFAIVTYNGDTYEPHWDADADKCVYLCTSPASGSTVVTNAELSSADLTKAYPNAGNCTKLNSTDKVPDENVMIDNL